MFFRVGEGASFLKNELQIIQQLLSNDEIYEMMNKLNIGIFLLNKKGQILFANTPFCQMIGYSLEQLKVIQFSEIFEKNCVKEIIQFIENKTIERAFSPGKAISGKKKDDSPICLQLHSLKKYDDETALFIVTDVTAQTNVEETKKKLAETIKELEDLKFALDEAATVSITDVEGNIIYVNDKFCEISKYSREELIGQNHRIVKSGYHPKELYEEMWKTITSGKVWRGEVCNKAKDGSIWWGGATIVPFIDKNGKPYQYIGIRSDITEKKLMEEKIRQSTEMIRLNERRFRTLLQNAYDVICLLDQDGVITEITPNVYLRTLSKSDDIVGKSARNFIHKDDLYLFNQFFNNTLKNKGKSFKKELRLVYGKLQWDCEVTLTNFIHDEAVRAIAVNIRDITMQKNAQRRIYEIAYFDSVTKLPNRKSFEKTMKETLQTLKPDKDEMSIMIVYLRNYKSINDSLGMDLGDMLLNKVADRLWSYMNGKGEIYHLSDDEFVLTFQGNTHSMNVETVEDIIHLFEYPFHINGYELYLTINIGKSVYPYNGFDFRGLLTNAYTALYQAKAKGGNQYHIFASKGNTPLVKMHTLKNDLLNAVKNQEFFLNYQPRINTRTNEIIGAEALIRWNHPKFGLVPPNEFIVLAEETGLIGTIGEYVLFEACKQNKTWQNQGFSPIVVSVNFSVVQFLQSNMIENIKVILNETKLDPEWLEIEITETVVMKDEATVLDKVKKLKDMGIKIAIDDFGTGYASLSYLKKLQANTIKIDRSFINGLPHETDSSEIVSTIVQLAQKLKMKTVAEGVETRDQLYTLKKICCDEVQGYLYSKPVIVNEFERLLKNRVCFPLA